MIHGGVDPGLLDEVIWWESDTSGCGRWLALAVYVRVAAERTGHPVTVICERLAERHGVELNTQS